MTVQDWYNLLRVVGVWGVIALASAWFLGYRVWPFLVESLWPFITSRYKQADLLLEQSNAERRAERTEYLKELEHRDQALVGALRDLTGTLDQRDIKLAQELEARNRKIVEALEQVANNLQSMNERRRRADR